MSPRHKHPGFALEAKRRTWANRGQSQELRASYRPGAPTIPDNNTPEFWEQKFVQDVHASNPIRFDRDRTIANLIQPHEHVLNLGVGPADFEEALYARKIPVDFTGTDFTEQNLAVARKKFPQWQFLKRSFKNLKFPAARFDVVTLMEVVEHLPPATLFPLLKQVHQVLKPGGRLIITIPVNEGLEEMYPVNPNAHVRVYSEELIRWEVEEAGFAVQRVYRRSAFSRGYSWKNFLNRFFQFRQPNNLFVVAIRR